jgi:Ca2+-binding RTX toxin-like protein
MARINGTSGADNRHGTAGADHFEMYEGADSANGWAGADYMDGGAGADTLQGADGADTLYGNLGDDEVRGGDGRDVLVGGPGFDKMWGGAGADSFQFNKAYGFGDSDAVMDFQRGVDVIDLRGIDANWNAAGDQAYRWIGTADFSGRAGELRVAPAGGGYDMVSVAGDNDGDGQLDFSILVQGVYNLGAGDFLF